MGVVNLKDTPRKVVRYRTAAQMVNFRIFERFLRNYLMIFVLCLFSNFSRIFVLFSFVGFGRSGFLLCGLGGLVCCCVAWAAWLCRIIRLQNVKIHLLFHNRFIAKLFGEYLSFFQLPLILVARLK